MTDQIRPQDVDESAPESTITTNPVVRNLGNRKSLRTAINAFCAHCMGCTEDHREEGFIADIHHCTSVKCPLRHFRPYKAT